MQLHTLCWPEVGQKETRQHYRTWILLYLRNIFQTVVYPLSLTCQSVFLQIYQIYNLQL